MESCRSLESLGYEVLEERRPGLRRSSMNSCRSFESVGSEMQNSRRQGLRRASLDRSIGTRSLTKAYSNENLMESCHSLESLGSEMMTNSRRPGQKRGSLSRTNASRCLVKTNSNDSLMSCLSFEGNNVALDRRKGGLRRSQSTRIVLALQNSWNASLDNSKHGGAERRSSLNSVSSTISLHRRVAKRGEGHNSVSTMSTAGTMEDEVEAMIEDVKQAIRQKVARQATLQSHIQSDKELAKARYMSDNERGAMLSMRRIHKLTAQQEKVSATCSKLLQLQKQLEEAVQSAEGIYNLDLLELQSSLEDAFDVVEDEDHKMPVNEELQGSLHMLSGRFEI